MPIDPFHIVKKEVTDTLKTLKVLFQQWKANNHQKKTELESLREQIRSIIDDINDALSDLVETIEIVQKNRNHFKVNDAELTKRKKFIQSVESDIEFILCEIRKKELIDSDVTQFNPNDVDDEDLLIQQYQSVTKELTKEQEKYLDSIEHSLNTLYQVGQDIENEVTAQNNILDTLNIKADTLFERIRKTSQAIDQFLVEPSQIVASIAALSGTSLVLFTALVLL